MAGEIVSVDRLRELLSYDPETGVFVWLRRTNAMVPSGAQAGSVNAVGYRYITIKRKHYLAHRLAWAMSHGSWPAIQIDHINCIKDDNRLCNLREATRSLNMENRRYAQKNNVSGLLGAHWAPKDQVWVAHITLNRKTVRLGCFQSPELAHEAYLRAKRLLHKGCTL